LDVSSQFAELLRDLINSTPANEIAETLGALVTEPVLTIFEHYAGRDDLDPKEFARAFHGFMISLNVGAGLADTALESISGGQIEGAGRMLTSMYWSLGLGFLGWQTLAPLLGSGLQPGLERYYKRLYRPQRFSAGDLRDMYALGSITKEQLADSARTEGWRDQDIEQWIKLAFRTLTQGEIWKALHDGLITDEEATRRLRAIGYDPTDIPLLFKLNPKEEQDTAKSFTVTTARQAYREHLIAESELRSILADLKYQPKEIDLIVKLEDLQRDTTQRGLSVSQIKAAWTENVITDPEAEHWLEEAGVGADEIAIIIATWRSEIAPVYRTLNIGTIEGAYIEGILTREQAEQKLIDVGLRREDAVLELNLVEKRNPAAFGQPEPVQKRVLSPSQLADLFTSDTITLDQLRTRLQGLGYSPEDAALLTEAARVRMLPQERKLPQGSIERGYLAGVLTREQAKKALVSIGYSEASADVLLTTLENENPDVFGGEEPVRLQKLSAGVLEDLVIGGQIDAATMRERLGALGYTQADADLLTERAVQLATPPVRILSQSTIERAYIAGILDQTQALEKLLEADFTPEEAATIVATVEAENPAVFNPELVQVFRAPSISALAVAVSDGIISEDDYRARAAEIGYRPPDIDLYLALAGRTQRKGTVALSTSQIVNAYGAGYLPWGTALSRLGQRGYDDQDATLLLRLEKDLIENTDVWNQLLTGGIGPFDAIAQLMSANYADADILSAFEGLGPLTLAQMELDLNVLAQILKETPGGA
jgi:hypothetical protein